MKFTTDRRALQQLLKAVAERPLEEDTVTLSACAGRVFVECKGDTAGIEAFVFEDGAVSLASTEILSSSQDLQRHALVNFRGKRGRLARPNFLDASARLRSAPEAADVVLDFGLHARWIICWTRRMEMG